MYHRQIFGADETHQVRCERFESCSADPPKWQLLPDEHMYDVIGNLAANARDDHSEKEELDEPRYATHIELSEQRSP